MKKTIFFAALVSMFCAAYAAPEYVIASHAHRGEPYLAPSNTVESIDLAFKLGALMIETDFVENCEGEIICIHDRGELKRQWGIDKAPFNLTVAEARAARLANPEKYDKKYADVHIPTIDEILAVIPKDKRFELEIKLYGKDFADKVAAAFKRAGLTEKNVIITSFSVDTVADFKRKYPSWETLLIVSPKSASFDFDEFLEKAKSAKVSQVAFGNYRKTLTPQIVKKFHDAGLKVGLWQVETLDDLAFAARLGADRVCSNWASRLRSDFNLIKSIGLK